MGEPAPELNLREPSYPVDGDHQLWLELVDPGGQVVSSFRLPAPLNKNTQATFEIQVTLAHEDGCSRLIARAPLRPY